MRLLPANDRLVKMGIIQSTSCNRCNFAVEDIKHMFWECKDVLTLWDRAVVWINNTFHTELTCDPRTVSLNLLDNTGLEVPDVVWLCLLICKKYIWIARCTESALSVKCCVKLIKSTEMVEAAVAVQNNKFAKHLAKWDRLCSIWVDCINGNLKDTKINTARF